MTREEAWAEQRTYKNHHVLVFFDGTRYGLQLAPRWPSDKPLNFDSVQELHKELKKRGER